MNPYVPPGHKGYEIRRQFKGVGQIRLASGTTNRKLYESYNTLLTKLWDTGRLDLLRAIKRRELTLREVLNADRTERLTYTEADVKLGRPLWAEVDRWLPASAKAEGSRKRYAASFARLKSKGAIHEDAAVSELVYVDWSKLYLEWGASGYDWNRMRAAVSRFLTMLLAGDKFHPFRRRIMAAMPRAPERRRTPADLDVDLFWKVVAKTPDYVQAAYVAMAATGAGPAEYLALEPHHLRPHTRTVQIPGTKASERDRVVKLGPEAWAWVKAAVPSPLQYKWLRIHFKRAVAELGYPNLRLYDLRHLYGHMLSDAGLSDAKIATPMGHADPATTRRYTAQADTEDAARAIEVRLFGEGAA